MRSAASQNCATELARYAACSGVRRATATSSSLAQRGVEISADAVELRRPGGERIGLRSASSMSRIASAELVQVVLNAQQLQRVPAVAVGEIGLQLPQAGNLPRDVPRVGDHRRERDQQAQQQGRVGDRPGA